MSELWPQDVKTTLDRGPIEEHRPFKCLLLMPFEGRFDAVADLLKNSVIEVVDGFKAFGFEELPRVQRLDWVTSSGVIQQEIWREIYEADLVFCDVTGYNANVLFEAGVAAAWKPIQKVVLIRDQFYRGQSPFDLAPIRYTEYAMTSEGVPRFKEKIKQLVTETVISFPDGAGSPESITLPLHIDFADGHDDARLYTPPFSHRRVIQKAMEFGSLAFFSHSWASVGKRQFLNFSMDFQARFSNPQPGAAYIGVGLRSQHFFANFAHILYLNQDGSIVLTQPDETPPAFYSDIQLRASSLLDLHADHDFRISFDERKLTTTVDGFTVEKDVSSMPKVLGPGLIRFQAFRTWMSLIHVDIREA
jgi:hypothetical protein